MIDAHTAFVGGINLHDDRDNAGPEDAPRYDYAVRVCGPVVADIQHTMRQLWLSVAFGPLVARGPQALTRLLSKSQELHADTRPAGVQSARLLVRDNGRHRLSIEQSYLRQIRRAQHEILIANAYFLPGLRLRHALCDAARRGVKVKLLLQGRVDHAILHYATRMLYRDFLNSGIEIHEYQAGYMHAKVAVIDRRWLFVGSMNLDPRSATINTELGMVVDSPPLAREMLRIIDIDRLQSAYRLRKTASGQCCEWLGFEDDGEMLLTEEPDSSLWQRVKLWLLRPFVPESLL